MPKYRVEISLSVCIEANNEDQAQQKATDLVVDGLDIDDVDAACIKTVNTELLR